MDKSILKETITESEPEGSKDEVNSVVISVTTSLEREVSHIETTRQDKGHGIHEKTFQVESVRWPCGVAGKNIK